MAAAWGSTATVVSAAGVNVVAATGTFTIAAGTWTTTPTAGMWVRMSQFAAGNNGYFKVAATPAPTTTTFVVENKDDLADETGSGDETIIQGAQIVNGVAMRSFAIEREHEDLSSVFELYRGMTVETFSLEIPVDGRITGTFGFMGKDELANSATAGDGSPNAANENDIVSSANDLQWINIAHGSVCLLSGSFEVTNALREIRCAGELSPHALGAGRFSVTGDLELLFEDHTQKDRYLAHTPAGFAVAIEDGMTTGALGLGNAIVFEVPSFHFTDDETAASGVDTELSESTSFEAFMNPDEDITMRITVWPAA